MKHCVFGGSFDPPHEGHRHLARTAFARLGLDRVHWVPAQDPPHKATPGTAYRDRLEMVKLAIAAMPGHLASDIEARLPTPSFTLNTLRALKAEFPQGDSWFLLIGADNWAIFPKWHRPDDVLAEASLVVYPRAGTAMGALPAGVQALELAEVPGASTQIRAALAGGASPESAGLLPELRAYVSAQGLYPAVKR